jgi:DNA-binding NtrC family response regulator
MSYKSTFKIFLVEDDPWYGQLFKHHLSNNPDFEIQLFAEGKQLLSQLYTQPDLVCIDFGLPDMSGDKLLKEIRIRNQQIPVIVISAQEEISVAVSLLKMGAQDYIIKDNLTKENLWKSVMNIREKSELKTELASLRAQLDQKFNFENYIIGQSEAIKKTFHLLQKAIQSNINVSLSGETGTGKEVFAKAIHFNSDRKKKPFVAVNMSAIPKELLESELFGAEKGAFTGAVQTRIGKFEEAEGGTLFLDEIGEMPLALQSKILRVLQEREIVRIGGSKTIKLNIRLITATHKNLSEEVKNGNFREDLFFRLVGLPIHLPTLKERDNDVIILAKYFIDQYRKENSMRILKLSDTAKTKLKQYHWPGNVRELKAVIDLACVMAEDKEILVEDLTFYEFGNQKVYNAEEKTLKEYQQEIITHYLNKYNQNVVLVAEKLEIGKSKIYQMIKKGEIKLK